MSGEQVVQKTLSEVVSESFAVRNYAEELANNIVGVALQNEGSDVTTAKVASVCDEVTNAATLLYTNIRFACDALRRIQEGLTSVGFKSMKEDMMKK